MTHPIAGERNKSAKLKEADVVAIRASNELLRKLAARYGVSIAHVCLIRKRRKWKHVQ